MNLNIIKKKNYYQRSCKVLNQYTILIFRLIVIFLMFLHAAIQIFFFFPFLNVNKQNRSIKKWCSNFLKTLGVVIDVDGVMPNKKEKYIYVSNHISWLDIQVFLSVINVRFIAKKEVESWILIGWLARRIGTIFIKRKEIRDVYKINKFISKSHDLERNVLFFPEGTTSDGMNILKFHSSLFESAVVNKIKVAPVVIKYLNIDNTIDTIPAYIKDNTVFSILINICLRKRTFVKLKFLPMYESEGLNRKELSNIVRDKMYSFFN